MQFKSILREANRDVNGGPMEVLRDGEATDGKMLLIFSYPFRFSVILLLHIRQLKTFVFFSRLFLTTDSV